MNELMIVTEFEVQYEPSVISVKNEDKLTEMVEKTAAHYKSLVFSDENILEAKQARKELNDITKMIDDQRKAVKNGYSAPLNEFEGKMKKLTGTIKEVSDNINAGIKDFDEREQQKRAEELDQKIAEIAEAKGVPFEMIPVQPSWTNKTGFLGKKMLEEIESAVDIAWKELERIAGDKKVIGSYATIKGLEPDSWMGMVEQGHSAAELMPLIDKAAEEKANRLAKEEQERKAKEEYDAAIAQMELEKQEQVGEVVIDRETGEIVDEAPRQVPEVETQTVILQLTGTIHQFQALNQKIVELGIAVKEVG
ncbi:DUF1351 domain-containing protein [Enterococcus sp. 2201sp1_2201st1_B8_2201SCRN_220225]|uniref:DUF1351 domain-containing protein n=1 Tax=unclassified Enterococcus TaxID=2608891 RepID=UPI0034A424A9